MKTFAFLLAACAALVPAVTHAATAENVPLSLRLAFPERADRNPATITFVASPEIAQLVIAKKLRLLHVEVPLGNAVTVNTENALRSAFAKVRIARSRGDVDDGLVLEVRSLDVAMTWPWTFFGTFTSKVKFVFVLRDLKTGTEREITVEGDGANQKNAVRVVWDIGWTWTEPQQLAKATDLATIEALDKLLDALRG